VLTAGNARWTFAGCEWFFDCGPCFPLVVCCDLGFEICVFTGVVFVLFDVVLRLWV